ncbi:hypothetical protein FJZ36_02740 [Candidatus Poribacteria bacterium]|nr:hypothetical protein [Candidatus Poribacteria bacterium]
MRDHVPIRRAPIETPYQTDWWHLGRAHLLARMSDHDLAAWERGAHRIALEPNQPLVLPDQSEAWAYVVATGRMRVAIPKAGLPDPSKPKPADAALSMHLVSLAEPGDVLGNHAEQRLYRPDTAGTTVDALRATRLWAVPREFLRQYLWTRRHWTMPVPLWARVRALQNRGVAMIRCLPVMSRVPAIPLADLVGRSMTSRAGYAASLMLSRGASRSGKSARIRSPLALGAFARMIGADIEWTRRWTAYCRYEGVLSYRLWRWIVLDTWRLSRWADRPAFELAFDLPPDPVQQLEEADERLGRPSRRADGTTPADEPIPEDTAIG